MTVSISVSKKHMIIVEGSEDVAQVIIIFKDGETVAVKCSTSQF